MKKTWQQIITVVLSLILLFLVSLVVIKIINTTNDTSSINDEVQIQDILQSQQPERKPKFLWTEEAIITLFKPEKIQKRTIKKGWLEKPINVGWGQKMRIMTVPASNMTFWVRMGKSVGDLESSAPQIITVDEFNCLRDDLDFKVFDFSIPPDNKTTEEVGLRLYTKEIR